MSDELEVARTEVSIFFQQMTAVKAYAQSKHSKDGQVYTLYKDGSDPNLNLKVTAVHTAVDTLAAKGIALPNDMRFYLNNAYGTQNRAYHFDTLGKSVSWLSLGSTASTGGSGSGISAQSTPGFDPATKIAIHEIGHSLHAANIGVVDFFKKSSAGGRLTGACPACAGKVSQYAQGSKKEFVAEVFLGLVIGRSYSNDVLTEYNNLGGPNIPGSQPMQQSWVSARPRRGAIIGGHRG